MIIRKENEKAHQKFNMEGAYMEVVPKYKLAQIGS